MGLFSQRVALGRSSNLWCWLATRPALGRWFMDCDARNQRHIQNVERRITFVKHDQDVAARRESGKFRVRNTERLSIHVHSEGPATGLLQPLSQFVRRHSACMP